MKSFTITIMTGDEQVFFDNNMQGRNSFEAVINALVNVQCYEAGSSGYACIPDNCVIMCSLNK